MGSYGIGIERILCAAIELYADKERHVAAAGHRAFEVVVTPIKYSDLGLRGGADQLYAGSKRPRRRSSTTTAT